MRPLMIAFMVLSALTLLASHWPQPQASIVAKSSAAPIMQPDIVILSDQDIVNYKAIFAETESGNYASADNLLGAINNPLLIGHSLAERYLEHNYNSSPEELSLWLQNFYDHPQAPRIAALAKRKGVEGAHSYATAPAPLKGRGYAYHLGAKSLPKQWYLGISAWKQQSYERAAKHFTATANIKTLSGWNKAAAHYWAARAYAQLKHDDLAQAQLYSAASYKTTLYGILANQKLGYATQLSAASPFVSANSDEIPAYLRAKALALVGQNTLAEAELRQLYTQLPKKRRPELLAMAGELGLANLQIRLSRLSSLHEDEALFASYPLPGWVMQSSETIDPALSLAVSRQESAFNTRAKSHAGAQGVMQVIPQTAAHVVKHPQFASLNEAIALRYNPADLLDPTTNVKIGSSYLNILRNKPYIADSLIHMLAGYNAGPGNVAAWSKAGSHITDPLLYMESIPFAETRNYVVQTLTHYVIYQTLLGQQDSSIHALNNGQFPLYHYEG